jgi:leucyl-tRNA synthetase
MRIPDTKDTALNVLQPHGYDNGLPGEQYAIQTGQRPKFGKY